MAQFHERTLALLGSEELLPERSAEGLRAWAVKKAVSLPASFLEWAKLDGGSLLKKYSLCMSFWFDEPDLIVTPEGVRGLRFNSHPMFDRIITLDQGDDPMVLSAWMGQPPWGKFAERFSDAVLAQIFDFQYMLRYKADDPGFLVMANFGWLEIESEGCLDYLRRHYEEVVTTRFVNEDGSNTEYRFMKSELLRITVRVLQNGRKEICITGQSTDEVKALELELKSVFAIADE